MTAQQLAGMTVLLQQQAAAAAMFSSGAFNPLDPVAVAAAMQTQFANAVAASAANQMLAMQAGPMGGQPGGPSPFAHLPPPGPPFGAAGLFRPPSGGNLAGFGGAAYEMSDQQAQQTYDGERSFGQRRDAGGCCCFSAVAHPFPAVHGKEPLGMVFGKYEKDFKEAAQQTWCRLYMRVSCLLMSVQ